MPNKTKAILLLTILLLNLFGYYVAFNSYEKYLKKENKLLIFSKMPEKSLEIMAIPTIDTQNKKIFKRIKSWEFEYYDVMFDFFKEITKNDTTYFYGFTDNKEIRLNKIRKFVSEQDFNSNKQKTNNRLSNILKLINFPYILSGDFLIELLERNIVTKNSIENNYQSIIIFIESPPPNYIT